MVCVIESATQAADRLATNLMEYVVAGRVRRIFCALTSEETRVSLRYHLNASAYKLVLFTVMAKGAQPLLLVKLNFAIEGGKKRMVLIAESLQPKLLVAVSFTWYIRAALIVSGTLKS
jgi:hypothetical protein